MQDTILKGTGNSRSLKSVENFKALYPTYDDFAAALVAGTLPVDLGGLNGDGVEQTGTALSTENLLTEATAADFKWLNTFSRGIPETPNQAFYLLAEAVANGCVTYSTYKGTGTYGSANTNKIFMTRAPVAVFVYDSGGNFCLFPCYSTAAVYAVGSNRYSETVTWNASRNLYWYSTVSAAAQMNTSGETYRYFAIYF